VAVKKTDPTTTIQPQYQEQPSNNKLVLKIRKCDLRTDEPYYSSEDKPSVEVKKSAFSTKKTICKLTISEFESLKNFFWDCCKNFLNEVEGVYIKN